MIERIDRKEFDEFSAKLLLNFALINTAAIAAALSTNGTYSAVPYALGLFSSILSQIFWYYLSAFDFRFGEVKDPINQKIELYLGVAVLILGTASGTAILGGCFLLLGIPKFLSLLLSLLLGMGTLALLIVSFAREAKHHES